MIGQRIRELRISKELTLKQLGLMLNLGESTMSMYENGKRSPDYDTVLKLAEIFEVSTDFLLGRTNEKIPGDRISNAIKDDAELARFWETMKERPELKIMFNQTKDLSPKAIQQVIRIIKAIEDEEDREDG